MRIRSIKPEFWRSDDVTSLPISARLTFIGMWSYVDDNGVGNAKLSSIIGDLYAEDMAGDPQETLQRVSCDLLQLENAGLLLKYKDPGHPNRELYFVTNWASHQLVNRPSKGHEYPLPSPETVAIKPNPDDTQANCMSVSGVSQETLSAGAGEQGSRGAGEQSKDSSSGSADAETRPEVISILDAIDQHCADHDFRKPNRTDANLTAARLILDKDGYTLEQVLWILNWVTKDSFWTPNIRSASKLREKFEQIKAKATTTPTNTGRKSSAMAGLEAVADWQTPDHLLLEN